MPQKLKFPSDKDRRELGLRQKDKAGPGYKPEPEISEYTRYLERLRGLPPHSLSTPLSVSTPPDTRDLGGSEWDRKDFLKDDFSDIFKDDKGLYYFPDEAEEMADWWVEHDFYGRAGAGILLREKSKGLIFLMLRGIYQSSPHTWGIPGGRMARNSAARATAIREAREETGNAIDSYKLKVEHKPFHTWDDPDFFFKFYTFLGTVSKPFKPKLDFENEAYVWIDPKVALKKGYVKGHPLHENVIRVLKKYVKTLPKT